MVKVLETSNHHVMLDVGGAILTVYSRYPNETELILGGITPGVKVSAAVGEPLAFPGTTLYLRYESTRDIE